MFSSLSCLANCCIYYLSAFPLQFAEHLTPSGNNDYYGLHVTMDVYGHKLKPGQVTSTTISVTHSGDGVQSSFNAIHVGWHVSIIFPDMNFNVDTRLGTSRQTTCIIQ